MLNAECPMPNAQCRTLCYFDALEVGLVAGISRIILRSFGRYSGYIASLSPRDASKGMPSVSANSGCFVPKSYDGTYPFGHEVISSTISNPAPGPPVFWFGFNLESVGRARRS